MQTLRDLREFVRSALLEGEDDSWLERAIEPVEEELRRYGFELRRKVSGISYDIVRTPFAQAETSEDISFGAAAEIDVGLIELAMEKIQWRLVTSRGGMQEPKAKSFAGEEILGTSDIIPGSSIVRGRLSDEEKRKDHPRWSWKTIVDPAGDYEKEVAKNFDEPAEDFLRVFVKGNFRCKIVLRLWSPGPPYGTVSFSR